MNSKQLAKYSFACSYIGNVLGEATAVSESGAAWAMGKDYVVWLNIEKVNVTAQHATLGINVEIADEWEMPDKLYQIFGYCQYQGIPCRII